MDILKIDKRLLARPIDNFFVFNDSSCGVVSRIQVHKNRKPVFFFLLASKRLI